MILGIESGNIFEYIEKYKLDGIMNAANALGPMGAGIAGAIRKFGGIEIQDDAFRVCKENNYNAGDSYITIAGKLESDGIKNIVHAVTMKNPGGKTSYEIVEKAFKSALNKAKESGITNIGCTSLGTGIGGLDPFKVANRMYNVAKDHSVGVLFVDFNDDFVKKMERLVKYPVDYNDLMNADNLNMFKSISVDELLNHAIEYEKNRLNDG